MLDAQLDVTNGWKVHLESKGCKRVAAMAEEMACCWEAEDCWLSVTVVHITYEWMVDAGRTSVASPTQGCRSKSPSGRQSTGPIVRCRIATGWRRLACQARTGRRAPPPGPAWPANYQLRHLRHSVNVCLYRLPAGSAKRAEADDC
jgi:hypothetical protein